MSLLVLRDTVERALGIKKLGIRRMLSLEAKNACLERTGVSAQWVAMK